MTELTRDRIAHAFIGFFVACMLLLGAGSLLGHLMPCSVGWASMAVGMLAGCVVGLAGAVIPFIIR